MSKIQEAVDVEVPVSVAYNQWTQFEYFPHFMGGVESITQTDATHSHWVTKIGGVKRDLGDRDGALAAARAADNALAVTMRPPFAERAKVATTRSISPVSRTLTGFTSIPSEGAAVWMAPHWPMPTRSPRSSG